jgi:hypothetical protein
LYPTFDASSIDVLPSSIACTDGNSSVQWLGTRKCSLQINRHATTSVEDEKWVEQVFAGLFDGKSPEMVGFKSGCTSCFTKLITAWQITPVDFKRAAKKMQENEPDIQHWTFGRYVQTDYC